MILGPHGSDAGSTLDAQNVAAGPTRSPLAPQVRNEAGFNRKTETGDKV